MFKLYASCKSLRASVV